MRTFIAEIEDRYGIKLTAKHVIMSWIVRHGSFVLNRFGVNKNGVAPYEEVKKKVYDHFLMMRGEKVLWHRTTDGAVDSKLERRFLPGIWVGKLDATDEHLMLTEMGLRKSRTVK